METEQHSLFSLSLCLPRGTNLKRSFPRDFIWPDDGELAQAGRAQPATATTVFEKFPSPLNISDSLSRILFSPSSSLGYPPLVLPASQTRKTFRHVSGHGNFSVLTPFRSTFLPLRFLDGLLPVFRDRLTNERIFLE